jgi:hypothetical protein
VIEHVEDAGPNPVIGGVEWPEYVAVVLYFVGTDDKWYSLFVEFIHV